MMCMWSSLICKAFDKVDHKVLLQKLVAIGISGKLLKWIGGFLIGRTHAVVVDGAKSEAASVNSGVPQGSVLGPLLFLVLISDIDANLNSASASSFADDTRVIMPIKCDGDRLQMQQDLSNVYKWAIDKGMVFYDAKFECLMYMCHANSSRPPDYLNNAGQSIEVSEEVKDLGILMSGNGSYCAHLGEIVTKTRHQVGWIFRTFSCRDRVSMLTIYKATVLPILEYCSQLWGPTKTGDIKLLESIQRSFTSKINEVRELSYWDRLKLLDLHSLERRRDRYSIMYVYKIITGLVPNF